MNWPNLQRVVSDVIRTGDDVRRSAEANVRQQIDQVASWVVPRAVEAVVSRIDLTDLVARHVDINALVARVDVDAVAWRLDLLGIAQYVIDGVDLPDIVRSSSASLTAESLQRVRIRGADADSAVSRAVERLKPHRHNGGTRIAEPAG
jgi:hypothetical protein